MIVHLFHSTIVSGPETLTLPGLLNLGEEVQVVFLNELRVEGGAQGPIDYARGLGFVTHSVDVRSRWDLRAEADLRALLQRLKPRLVHAHDVKASFTLGRSARGLGIPLVSTHHGAAARRGLTRLYEEIYVRWVLPAYHLVFCVCEADRASLVRRGLRSERVVVQSNGVDRKRVDPSERAAVQRAIRAQWGIPSALPVVGAVARLSWEKRHDRMLRAIAASGTRVELVFFGVGPEREKLESLASELGVSVRWMGYSRTIGQEMAGFDLLLCLSDGEGLPINLIEAGWAATPVLSTSVGAIPELLEQGRCGWLVPVNLSDAEIGARIHAVLSDSAALAETGARFQARVESEYSGSSWLRQLRDGYLSI